MVRLLLLYERLRVVRFKFDIDVGIAAGVVRDEGVVVVDDAATAAPNNGDDGAVVTANGALTAKCAVPLEAVTALARDERDTP